MKLGRVGSRRGDVAIAVMARLWREGTRSTRRFPIFEFFGIVDVMATTEPEDLSARPSASIDATIAGLASAWAEKAVEHLAPTIERATTDEEVRAVMLGFAELIVREGQRRFGSQPRLAERWREVALEAACSRLSAFRAEPS